MSERRVELHYFSIVALPICVFLIHELIQTHMLPKDLDLSVGILIADQDWLETVGRYRFLAASWFFVALAILPVAVLVRNLRRPTERATRLAAILTVVTVFCLAMIPVIQQHMTNTPPQIYGQVGKELFEMALSKGTLPGCDGPDDLWALGTCGDIPVFSLFRRVMDIVTALAGLAVGALIAGMILCLSSGGGDDLEDTAASLARSIRQMKQQLYLSSLILTFGMFFASSWMYWPLPVIAEAEKAAFSSLVTASALFTGTYFCLLMLSFYLPVALILDGRVTQLAIAARQIDEAEDDFDVDGWRSTHGLSDGPGDFMRAGIALAAPILAAFAGGISPLSL
ncbi:hypothetical protein ABLN87_05200 [Ruegeria sp. SCPT10]|uniref:hypothetical protein n=1 Tax=Ruegeria sp. SCP10 TaxID=3141377 RepID=UPI003337385E